MMASRNAARSSLKAGKRRRSFASAAVGEAVLTSAVENALFSPREREQFAFEPKSATFTPIEFEFGDRTATLPQHENENGVQSATCARTSAGSSTNAAGEPNGSSANFDSKEAPTMDWQPHETLSARDRLTDDQRAAASALMLGGSIQATAGLLGIEQALLRKWVTTDPLFHAAMEEMRQELVVSMRQKMLCLAEKALAIVSDQLDREKGAQIALRLMRAQGMIGRKAHTELLCVPHVVPPETPPDANATHENGVQTATSNLDTAQSQSTRDPAAQKLLDKMAAAFASAKPHETNDAQTGTPEQEAAAVAALSAGHTPREAAVLAQISESKLRHWFHSNARFCLALAQQHVDRLFDFRNRLGTLLEKASRIVDSALTGGDGRIAIALLRGLGLLG